MEPLVLFTSRVKLVLLLVGGLVLTGGSAWILTQQLSVRKEIYAVAGIVLFGFATLYLVWSLLRPRPVLVVDADGITDSSGLGAVGRIAWSEIYGVRIASVRGRRMLAVDLVDADRALARVPAVRRGLLNANRAQTGTPVNIAEAVLPMPLEKLISEMVGRNPGLQVGF